MTRMARKATLRALPLCLHDLRGALLGETDDVCARGPAEKRSTLSCAGWAPGRAAALPSWGVSSRPVGRVAHMQDPRALGRDEPRLAERDRQRAEGDLAGVDGQDAVLDAAREPVQAARRRARAPGPWCPAGHSASRGRGTRTSSCWSQKLGLQPRCGQRWYSVRTLVVSPEPSGLSPSWKPSVGSTSWT